MTRITSAEAIGNIDVLTEILLRLPSKPLGKFKCVSKQWLSLISDPQFCLSYNRHHHTPAALLLKKAFDYTPEFEIIPLKQDTIPPKVPSFDYLIGNAASGFRIRQSCNGLLLCSTSYVTIPEFELEHIYYICNPTTKHFKRLSSPTDEFKASWDSVYMAFDPLKSNHYKVICVRRVKETIKYQIYMYSSETDSWSHLAITFTPPYGMLFSDAVFCNGAIHWYSKDETSLYFDVDKECLKTMPMPNLAQHTVWYFGESWGHLHLILTKLPYPLQFDVLEMAPDYSGWSVRYHVNLDDVRIAFSELNWDRFSVLHVIRAQKEEEMIVVVFVDNKAISYNVQDGTSKKLCDLELYPPQGLSYYGWNDTFQYFESLTYV